jgi:hypothetical protein
VALALLLAASGARPALAQELPAATPNTVKVPFKPIRDKILPEQLSDEQVLHAIDGGTGYLLTRLDEYLKKVEKLPDTMRGNPDLGDGELGRLMLITYTLLYVGQDIGDQRLHFRTDRMKIALDVVLRWDGRNTTGGVSGRDTYASALQALALAQLPATADVKQAMDRVATRLAAGLLKEGGYSYHLVGNESDQWDHSNSQYGLLGTWAANDWGASIPGAYWKTTDDFWRLSQNADGGWGYKNNGPTTFPMTCAGVASLLVCDEFLNRTPRLEPPADAAKERGIAALAAGFKPDSTDYYALYGLERVGLAGGFKYLGKTNWYRAAAVNVLTQQMEDGSFGNGTSVEADGIVNTCYCLLFLARGRAPVLMNKLQYPGAWNARPRDSANVHAYLAKAFERHLNWQSVAIDAPVEDWLDAPIMLITGYKAPEFTDDDVAKIRQFVNAGGIVFSIADGGSKEFTEAMGRYARAVAGEGYAFRELPKDHPLYNIYGKAQNPAPLSGVSNGIRELWIHSPQDLGAVWQAREMNKTKEGWEIPPKNREAWDVPARLFFYAAGKAGLRSKLQPLNVLPPKEAPSRTVRIAQLQFKGNWNPEPGAWPRLAKLLARDAHTDVAIDTTDILGLAKLEQHPTLAHLAGTGDLKLSADEEAALKAYVNSGGTLFVEAMGGDPTFGAAATRLLQKLFPQTRIGTIPRTYTLYNGEFSPDAVKISEVEYRKSWTLEHGQQTAPRLLFMTVNNRMAVVFSNEDITSGLLGTATWGVGGYTSDSALAIARNLVLFAQVNDAHK